MLVGTAYGSATADGLIGLLATAGVDRRSGETSRLEAPPADPRILGALRWLARTYTLDRNPGFGEDPRGWGKGLQNYYLAALAEGLHRAGVKTVITSDSIKHSWASELVRGIGEAHGLRGRQFGSDSGLMHEDEPTISAAFSIIALAAARDRLAQNGGSTIKAGAVPPRPPREIEEPPSIPSDARERGLAIFKAQSCFSCHQDGQATNAPSLIGVGDLYLAELRTEKRARARLQALLRAPDSRPSLRGGEWPVRMQPLSPEQVSDEALSDLIAFLLSCSGDRPVSGLR
jgi:mono/diheme cytochrome c family protein